MNVRRIFYQSGCIAKLETRRTTLVSLRLNTHSLLDYKSRWKISLIRDLIGLWGTGPRFLANNFFSRPQGTNPCQKGDIASVVHRLNHDIVPLKNSKEGTGYTLKISASFLLITYSERFSWSVVRWTSFRHIWQSLPPLPSPHPSPHPNCPNTGSGQ